MQSRIVVIPAISLLIEPYCWGSAGASAWYFPLSFVPVENKPVPARVYKGEKLRAGPYWDFVSSRLGYAARAMGRLGRFGVSASFGSS